MKKKYRSKKLPSVIITKIVFIIFIIFLLPIIFWASQYPQLISSEGKTVTNQLKPLQTSSLSNSKIGVFFLGANAAGKRIVNGGPRVIKVIDPHQNSEMMQLVRDYKRAYPDGLVVMRVYEGDSRGFGLGDDPQNSARDFWQNVLAPAVNKLSVSDRKFIDYLSVPNEYDKTPIVKNEQEALWTGRFWEALASIISENGFRPNIGEIPVGNFGPELISPIIPALRKVKETGGIWSYHAYTLDYTTDAGTESWTSLRYRMFYDYLRANYPDVADVPMILTEGGVDKGGNGGTDGWNARGDSASFENWLTWYDAEIQKDPYILGVTLFQSGNSSDWRSFNVDSISDWLANYLGGQPGAYIELPTQKPILIPTINIPTTIPTLIPTNSPTNIPASTITIIQLPTDKPITSIPTIVFPTIYTPSPTPTLTPTPTPSFFAIIRSNWDNFLVSFLKFTRNILP